MDQDRHFIDQRPPVHRINWQNMADVYQPESVIELVDGVRSAARLIACGAGTKPRLSRVPPDYKRVSLCRLRGIIEYEPSEFTFTALAGTPLEEIMAALAERGQYLPFDPPLAKAGATLGGTLAAGISGPGRLRFGGLRDFILGVQFVDGEGRLLRMGGKVVKNAAGFDLPKFFVGSLGRFGILAELTFKVFPRAVATRTLRLEIADAKAKAAVLNEAACTRWELDALECPVDQPAVFVRLAGPAAALGALTTEILGRWPGTPLGPENALEHWQAVSEFGWAHPGGTLIKVVLTPSEVPGFESCVRGISAARGWIGAGGNVGYLSVPAETRLPELTWPAMTLRGNAALWPGLKPRSELMRAVKHALDPHHRFPGLDD